MRENKLDVAHVGYKGGAPALQELANGQIMWMIDTPIGSLPLVRAGKLTPIAVIAPSRIRQLPIRPLSANSAFPNSRTRRRSSISPRRRERPRRFSTSERNLQCPRIKDPEFSARVDSFDSILPQAGMTPADATAAAERDYRGWFKLAIGSGIKVQ